MKWLCVSLALSAAVAQADVSDHELAVPTFDECAPVEAAEAEAKRIAYDADDPRPPTPRFEALARAHQRVSECHMKRVTDAYKAREQEQKDRAAAERAKVLAELQQQRSAEEEAAQRDTAEKIAQAKTDAATEAETEREHEAMRRDPRAIAALFGAIFCNTKAVRAAALLEIAKEKKYARIGGIENKSKIYGLQQQIRWADETEIAQRKNLRGFKHITPLSCNSLPVRNVMGCLGEAPSCLGEPARYLASFVPEYSTSDDDE